MFIQALPIKWICESALRCRKNAKLGFSRLYSSRRDLTHKGIVQDLSQKVSSQFPVKTLSNVARDLTSAPFTISERIFSPPVHWVSVSQFNNDKVKQTAGSWQPC